MNFRIIFTLFMAITVSSCSSATGGIIGNLFPAPKFLDGEIKGDTYYSPQDVFHVTLPHPPNINKTDNNEWLYTQIHEINDRSVIGVVLGPAAFDKNIYHAVLIRETGTPNNEPVEEYVKSVFKRKSVGRNRGLELKHYSKSVKNGKDFYYAVYAGNNTYLVLSMTDNNDSYYVVEADISDDSSFDKFESLEQLINNQWDLFNTMYDSFTIKNASYKH